MSQNKDDNFINLIDSFVNFLLEFKKFNLNINIDNIFFECYAKLNKNDDAIFNRYLRDKYPNQFVYNLEKPLVQHIDYLLGGSLLYDRKSVYETTNFDKDVVKEIEEKLKNEVYDT